MALYFSSINSGSNGNAYYVGNEKEAVLIDAGLSCREIEKRMLRSGLSLPKVKAIFVSHEHGDHITGIPALSKKYQLPVYITPATKANSNIPIEDHLVYSFSDNTIIKIGNLRITPFSKKHDAADPHSFFISDGKVSVGVFTDVGIACHNLIRYFKKCHAAFLESNYCEKMLMEGGYPYHLKKRISDGYGHLSNTEAIALFTKHRSNYLSHLILSHLSKNNNRPELVEQLFTAVAGPTRITVASRYQESEVFRIGKGTIGKTKPDHRSQLSLF